MKEKTKNFLSFLFRILLSGALLGYLYTKIDTQQTIATLKSVNLNYLFLAWFIFMVINVIILFRWYVLIKALSLSVPVRDVIRYFLIGLFGNLFLPSSIGGDILRIMGLCKSSSQKSRVFASVLLDRLSGFAAIVLVAISVFVLGYGFIDEKSLIIPIALMGFASLIVIFVLFNERVYSFCCRIFNKLPRFKKNLMRMHYDIMLLKDKQREGWKAIMLSCLSQVTLAFVFFLIAKALHQDIRMVYFFIFVPMICVVSSLPSIGGLGVREAGTVYLFSKIGVESGISVSMSLLLFLFMVTIGLIGGLVYVFTISSRRIQHSASGSSIDPENA